MQNQGWKLWLTLILCALTGGTAKIAHAGDPAEPAGYRTVIDEALREYELGNFEEARSLFDRAHRLFPNARTSRGLGMAEFELRNYGRSIAELEAALSSKVRPLDGLLRRETEELLARANGFAARITFSIAPQDSNVRVDGVPIHPSPGQAMVVDVGDHIVEVAAAGYLTERRNVSVRGGESTTLHIVLASVASETSAAPIVDTSPMPGASGSHQDRVRPWYKSPWTWTAVGVVVAAAALGGALAATRDGTEQEDSSGGTSGIKVAGPP